MQRPVLECKSNLCVSWRHCRSHACSVWLSAICPKRFMSPESRQDVTTSRSNVWGAKRTSRRYTYGYLLSDLLVGIIQERDKLKAKTERNRSRLKEENEKQKNARGAWKRKERKVKARDESYWTKRHCLVPKLFGGIIIRVRARHLEETNKLWRR